MRTRRRRSHGDAAGRRLFYGDNTGSETRSERADTLFGPAARGEARVDLNDRAAISRVCVGNLRFGSGSSFELVRPVLTLTVRGRRSRFLFGTLARRAPAIPPVPIGRVPTACFPPISARDAGVRSVPYEAGLQWLFKAAASVTTCGCSGSAEHAGHRERLDAGPGSTGAGAVPLPAVPNPHRSLGGQLFAAGPVRDSFVLASGVTLSNRSGAPRDPGAHPATTPPPGSPARSSCSPLVPPQSRSPAAHAHQDGAAFFGRASLEGLRLARAPDHVSRGRLHSKTRRPELPVAAAGRDRVSAG